MHVIAPSCHPGIASSRCARCWCRTRSPLNPFHKDAACPPAAVRLAQFSQVYDKDAGIAANISGAGPKTDVRSARLCDFLTFYGDPSDFTGARDPTFPAVNPTLPNAWPLTGALVASLDPGARPSESGYADVRGTVRPDGSAVANSQARSQH